MRLFIYSYCTRRLYLPPLVYFPQTEGIGTIRSHQAGPQYEDDGLSSDDGESDDEDDEDDEIPLQKLWHPPESLDTSEEKEGGMGTAKPPVDPRERSEPHARPPLTVPVPEAVVTSATPTTPTPAPAAFQLHADDYRTHGPPAIPPSLPIPPVLTPQSAQASIPHVQPKQPSSASFIPRRFLRRPTAKRASSVDSSGVHAPLPVSHSSPNLTQAL